MSLPKTMRAIKSIENGKAELKTDVPLPKQRDDYVLVKISNVGLNPTDWKHIDYMSTANATVGCDLSGTVVALGKDVKRNLKPGDRVCGVTHGVNKLEPEDGCYGDYALVNGVAIMKIPDDRSSEAAATLGVAITTIGLGLYHFLGLNLPNEPTKEKFPVLVYGGSSAMGLFACQMAKLSGYSVVATCSPKNNELVKSYGADAVFDYKDPQCAQKIREYTNDSLRYAFDCISEAGSTEICTDALSSKGGNYNSLLPVEVKRKDIKASATLAYTAFGRPISIRGIDIPAFPEHLAHTDMFWKLCEQLYAEGKFKELPVKKCSGGLPKVFEGLDLLRKGKVSGEKLVYNVSEGA